MSSPSGKHIFEPKLLVSLGENANEKDDCFGVIENGSEQTFSIIKSNFKGECNSSLSDQSTRLTNKVPMLQSLCQNVLKVSDPDQAKQDSSKAFKRPISGPMKTELTGNQESEEMILQHKNQFENRMFNEARNHENILSKQEVPCNEAESVSDNNVIQNEDGLCSNEKSALKISDKGENNKTVGTCCVHSKTGTIVRIDESEISAGNLPRDLVFVAREQEIYLYRLTNEYIGTNSEENRTASSEVENSLTFHAQEDRDGNEAVPPKAYCSICKTYHAPAFIFIPFEALLHSFENDIIKGLGNSPEDENNLCDNLLPSQIRYLSLIRQDKQSFDSASTPLDVENLKSLYSEYLNGTAKERDNPQILTKEVNRYARETTESTHSENRDEIMSELSELTSDLTTDETRATGKGVDKTSETGYTYQQQSNQARGEQRDKNILEDVSAVTTEKTQKGKSLKSYSSQTEPKKPFTGKIIKETSIPFNRTELASASSLTKDIIENKCPKKNKNVHPIRTTKESTYDENDVHKKGIWKKDSESFSSDSLNRSSGDSINSFHAKDDDNNSRSSNSEHIFKSPSENTVSNERNLDRIQGKKTVYKVLPNTDNVETNQSKISQDDTSVKSNFESAHHRHGEISVKIKRMPVSLDDQLKTAAGNIGASVFHVPSDGNCMFSAIVDQLKLFGDFKYTPQSLREKAVQYLRDNPIHDDGTPLECFLSAESWDSYLYRMGQKNTWGDYLVLNGIAELLKCRIMIVTVTSEQTHVNEIQPSRCDPEVTLTIGLKGESHFESLRPLDWEERLIELAKKPVTKTPRRKLEKKKRPRLAFAAMLAEGRHPMKSLSDICYDDEDNTDNDDIHVECVKNYTPECLLSSSYTWDHISNASTPHLSFILRLLYTSDCIQTREPLHYKTDEVSDKSDFGEYYLTGPCFQGTDVYLRRRHGRYEHSNPSVDCIGTSDWKRLFCMNDTRVVSPDFNEAGYFDLQKDEDSTPAGYLRLIPVHEASFSNQLVSSVSGKKFLRNPKPVEHKIYVKDRRKTRKSVEKYEEHLKSEDTIVFQTDWPQIATDWIDRRRPSDWPDRNCVEECTKMGCFVVPAYSQPNFMSKNMQDEEVLWQYSFAKAQGHLICKCLAKNQLHTFHLFKIILDECIHCPDILTTENLTQVFLYASEVIPQELWYKNSSACILFMLEYLLQKIEAHCIPNYFVVTQNMLDISNIDRLKVLTDRLRSLRRFPLVYILTCSEKHNLQTYRIKEALQTAINDMQSFKKDKNMTVAVRDTFFQLSVDLADAWIKKLHDFELGYNQIISAHDEWSRGVEYGLDAISFDRLINNIVRLTLSVSEKWLFVIFTEEKYQVNYGEDIFNNIPCHTLHDLIGEAAGRFENAVIPDSISSRRFECLQTFIHFLFGHLKLFHDVIPIAQYTIEKYADQLVELSIANIETYGSDMPNTNTYYQQQVKQDEHNRDVFSVYISLFNSCLYTGQPELFLPYIPGLENVCEKIFEDHHYKQLETISLSLGFEQKAKEIRIKRSQLLE